jgi:aminopeptidase
MTYVVCRAVRDHSSDVDRLAELLVGFGANLQSGQILGVTAYLGMEDAARAVARAAYKRGAKYVDVFWWDQLVKRARLELADDETLDYIPPWLEQRMEWLSDERAARVTLTGTSAGVFDGIDPARTGRDSLPYISAVPRIVNERTTNWTAGPCPNIGWAERVHPELEPEAALDKLWEEITYVLRLDTEDPVEAWQERMKVIVASADRMTDRRFDSLHLKGAGTDLTIGLLPSSKWLGADFSTADGITHYPNLPTEEVFTTPDPERVDGHVSATMPLELYGSYMNGIRIEFEGGRAVKVDADEGADALRATVAKDDGASRLGEIALVDKEGRIGPLRTVFYETLLDENAASHIALGNAYTFPVEDDADRERVNKSGIHVDFMIGSNELDVDGITRDGDRVPVLRGGAWQI